MTSVLELLNKALHQALAADENVVLLGEDILDPYGGPLKSLRGFRNLFQIRSYQPQSQKPQLLG